jgi:hypothetical protein
MRKKLDNAFVVPTVVRLQMLERRWVSTSKNGDRWFWPEEIIGGHVRTFDITAVRDAFLAIHSEKEAFGFFREYHCAWRSKKGKEGPVSFSDLLKVQAMLKDIVGLPLNRNLNLTTFGVPWHLESQLLEFGGISFDMQGTSRHGLLYFEIRLFGNFVLIPAFDILATLERTAKSPIRLCARDGCGRLFKSSDPRRIYCLGGKCKSIVTSRNNRARQRGS